METIVIQWFVYEGREDEMKRPTLSPSTTPGFLDEQLFREPSVLDGVLRFVNIGHWVSREAFYQAFPHARPGELQVVEEYEAGPRVRGWLETIPYETSGFGPDPDDPRPG